MSRAAIQISEWGRPRIEALLEASHYPLPYLFAQIADVIGRDDCLDVGGQTTATRIEPQIVVRKPNVYPEIDKIAKLGPVPEVARSPVDFVDDESVRLAF